MTPPGGEPGEFQRKLEILVEASVTLLGSQQLEDLLPAVLELARKLNEASACAIWQVGDGTWRITASSGLSPEFQRVEIAESGVYDSGDAPFCFEDLGAHPVVSNRMQLYHMEGIRSLVAMPLKVGGRGSATLTFYYRQPHHFSETELRVATALANLAAAAIETAELNQERQRSRMASEQARKRAAFMAEASEVLASSLDYETTLTAVARLAVPGMADWCVVHICQSDGTLKQLAVAHVDPQKMHWAQEIGRRYPPNPKSTVGPALVVRTGKPQIYSEVTDDLLARDGRGPVYQKQLRAIGMTSYMCVPLIVRDQVLGTIDFMFAQAERRYGNDDLLLAEDLARRAALAVDNALLYASAQRERTALETALTALRENEERLLMALDAGRMGIWDWDIATNELHWTDSVVLMHGFAPGEFDGTFETFLSAIHPDDRQGFKALLERTLADKSYFESEFRVVFPNGTIHWMAGKGKVYCNERGEAARMIGLGMDVTERRALEEKLQKSQKLESIGLLAGGIAHDFNNLLTGVMGNASLALGMTSETSPAARLLESVVHASERAADLTRQLLAYSGKGRIVIQPLDLSALVREITSLVNATIPKMVHLELEMGAGLPSIEADSSQIQQVVMNLVINAAEAIGDRTGQVVVRTGIQQVDEGYLRQFAPEELKVGPYVFLEVIDTGSGMDQATQAKIFDPFFTTKFTGRGLGLAAVSGIVRGHRGAIRVSSVPGQGSVFRVLFPAAQATAPHEQTAETPEDLAGSGQILVIDDEDTVRRTAEAVLCRYGYRVVLAEDGAQAVEIFSRSPGEFSAILLDLAMPVLGGEETLRMIKAVRPDVPVVVTSGYSEIDVSSRFSPGELAGFLQKPYTGAGLAAKMKEAVLRGKSQRKVNSQAG